MADSTVRTRSYGAAPSEVGAAHAVPRLLFPVIGDKEWELSPDQIAEWQTAFSALDVAAECRLALAWVKANRAHRKTAGGMPRFLVAWLARAQNRLGPPTRRPPVATPERPDPAFQVSCWLYGHEPACPSFSAHRARLAHERQRAGSEARLKQAVKFWVRLEGRDAT